MMAAESEWAFMTGVDDERAGLDVTDNPFEWWTEAEDAAAWDDGWWSSWAGPI